MSDRVESAAPCGAELSIEQASRLLRIGIHGPARPVDELLDRLAGTDGSAWLSDALATGPAAAFGPPDVTLARGNLTLEQLASIKQVSTRLVAQPASGTATLAAMAAYFFAVAAGLADFGTNLSSRPREDLEPILLDLASVTPDAWSDLFIRAAAALSRLS